MRPLRLSLSLSSGTLYTFITTQLPQFRVWYCNDPDLDSIQDIITVKHEFWEDKKLVKILDGKHAERPQVTRAEKTIFCDECFRIKRRGDYSCKG